MAIKLVQFQDKVNLNTNENLPEINKVIDDNMNELKDVANTNANNVGDLSSLQTESKNSVVDAINYICSIGPALKVVDKTINVNLNTVGNHGQFTLTPISGYQIASVQPVNIPSSDVNAVNFNVAGNTVYWICVRAGYGNSGNMVARVIYIREDLISES